MQHCFVQIAKSYFMSNVASIRGNCLKTLMIILGLTQTGLLVAIFQTGLMSTVNVIDVNSLNIYLSPKLHRKAF